MNYDALMAFAVFARHLNFTRAAEELFISQPALHQKVKRLSDELDETLYVKNGRDLVLTDAGELLAAHAREVSSLTDDVLARLDEQRGRGTVILATGPGAMLHLVSPIMKRLQSGPYPIRLLTMSGSAAAEAVRTARAHVCIGVYEGNRGGLDCSNILRVGQRLVLPEDHPLANRDALEPSDLEGESLVVPPAGHPARTTIERVLDGVGWSSSVEALGYELTLEFVSHGLGLAILNDYFELPDGFASVPFGAFSTVDFEVATRSGSTFEGAHWLVDQLVEAYA